MQRIDIAVPDLNDSFSRVVLSGRQYLIRFTYNDTCGFWTFGLYTTQREAIVEGVKIVPRFPLNLFCSSDDMPAGVFGAYSELEAIGRADFLEGKATFSYIPVD